MTEIEAMVSRRSQRQFDGRALEADAAAALRAACAEANEECGLHLQLVTDEREAFEGGLASYGSFKGVANYLALVGPKGAETQRALGYHGERIVLLAYALGIGSCWVGGTFRRRKASFELGENERLHLVVALGYAVAPGSPRRSKDASKVASAEGEVPDWFASGVAAALLAPTALNQQRFHFALKQAGASGSVPVVRATTSRGPFAQVDLGIACYHFELGAGRENFVWA
jgi:hypothetical protein